MMQEQALVDTDIEKNGEDKIEPKNNEKSTSKVALIVVAVLVLLTGIGVAIGVPIRRNRVENQPNITVIEGDNFVTIEGPFNTTLALYNDRLVQGYQSVDEFKADVVNVSAFLLNNVILRNTGAKGFESAGFGWNSVPRGGGMVVDDATDGVPEAAPGADFNTAGGKNAPVADVDDYGTNNQEDDVEQGDSTVSDGTYVYAIYGDYIIIWEARTGTQILEYKVPGIEIDQKNDVVYDWVTKEVEPVTGDEPLLIDVIAPGNYYYQTPYIEKLLLKDEKLVVVTSGYGYTFSRSLDYDNPILSDYLSTRITVFNTNSLANAVPSLTIEKTEDVNGRFTSARAIGDNVHIVTTSNVNTYELVAPLERYNFPTSDNNDAYVSHAREVGVQKVIPNFVDRLADELQVNGIFPELFRLSLYQEKSSGTALDQLVYGEGLMNSVVLVHSFNIQTSPVSDKNLIENIAGTFLASWWSQVYASADMLLVAGQGWHYDPEKEQSYETTYLNSFALTEASSAPHSIGEAKGNVMNSYAIDIVKDATYSFVLRLATTVQNSWFIDGPTFEQVSDRTENYISTFALTAGDTTESGSMQELGSIDLGKPNEVFTGLRFIKNRAYAVTFEQKDPLYIVDLTDPTKLQVIGQIDNITGFTNYFEPLSPDPDNLDYFLGIGQEADENGNTIGVQVSVFNFVNEQKPFLVDRYVVSSNQGSSSSDALWRFESIRYNAQTGILSIPVYIYDWMDPRSNFNGFFLFDVTPDGVQERCRIDHGNAQEDSESCYYCASLEPRSMIFEGKLTTMSSHFVRSTDIDNCERQWGFDILIEDQINPDYCCNYYYY